MYLRAQQGSSGFDGGWLNGTLIAVWREARTKRGVRKGYDWLRWVSRRTVVDVLEVSSYRDRPTKARLSKPKKAEVKGLDNKNLTVKVLQNYTASHTVSGFNHPAILFIVHLVHLLKFIWYMAD
jgi:hypothetical protein